MSCMTRQTEGLNRLNALRGELPTAAEANDDQLQLRIVPCRESYLPQCRLLLASWTNRIFTRRLIHFFTEVPKNALYKSPDTYIHTLTYTHIHTPTYTHMHTHKHTCLATYIHTTENGLSLKMAVD